MGLYMRVKLCRHLGKARAHVKYIAFRSREAPGESRGAFDGHRDHVDVLRFSENLEDRLTRHPMANKAYKMHLSLSEKEFRELGLTSWKPVVREAMENLQRQWGARFEWIAAEHMAKGHPHVHIAIKATCRDEEGRERQLRLDKEHLRDMKREVGRIIERDRSRDRERPLVVDRDDVWLRTFDGFLQAIVQEERANSGEIEREHQRWLHQRSGGASRDR